MARNTTLSVSLRIKLDTLKEVDALARQWGVSRASAADRLVVLGLRNAGKEAQAVAAEERAARKMTVAVKARLLAALRAELEEIEEEMEK